MQTEYMNKQHWQFMLADLRAAEWVIRIDPDLDSQTLGKKFLSIHQFFLRNIGRDRPGLFADVDREFLVTVVRKWIEFYKHAIRALGNRYPNTKTSSELQLSGINWSQGLGVSYEGILEGMSYTSRYAEFWAEMSLRDEECFHSYEDRIKFTGSPAYWNILELGNAKKLTVVDFLENSATSFDMIRVVRANPTAQIRLAFIDEGWTVENLDEESQRALRWYAAEGPDVLAPLWLAEAASAY